MHKECTTQAIFHLWFLAHYNWEETRYERRFNLTNGWNEPQRVSCAKWIIANMPNPLNEFVSLVVSLAVHVSRSVSVNCLSVLCFFVEKGKSASEKLKSSWSNSLWHDDYRVMQCYLLAVQTIVHEQNNTKKGQRKKYLMVLITPKLYNVKSKERRTLTITGDQ